MRLACCLLWAMKFLAFCMLFGLFYYFMHLGVYQIGTCASLIKYRSDV